MTSGTLTMTLLNQTTQPMVFHYATNWKEGKVCQMFIQQITPEYQECDHKYVAIALNPETNKSMVMSKPRSHYDTLQWVKKWCGSFCVLPEYC
jgi:hypothetical protein